MKGLRAPLWVWIATAGGTALFLSLAAWQLHRGQAKERWLAQFNQSTVPSLTLSASSPSPGGLDLQRASARGRWWTEQQLLQDGQSHTGRPGYHVWTPLRLAGGALVLVNRGWIPQPYDRTLAAPLAAPEGDVSVTGWWRPLPEPGIRLADGECRQPASFPAVVVYPRREQLACLLGQPVLPGLLLMDPLVPGGFVREWSVTGFPPERHYGYAVTWLALGLTAVILFVTLNLKRNDPTQS